MSMVDFFLWKFKSSINNLVIPVTLKIASQLKNRSLIILSWLLLLVLVNLKAVSKKKKKSRHSGGILFQLKFSKFATNTSPSTDTFVFSQLD